MHSGWEVIKAVLRRNRRLYAELRALKYKAWRMPGLRSLVEEPVEWSQVREIMRRSRFLDLPMGGSGPRILFFTLRGWSTHVIWDSIIAQALRLRGADCRFYTCGGRLPICDIASFHVAPPMPCDFCSTYTATVLSEFNLPYYRLHDFITPLDIVAAQQRVAAIPYEEYQYLTYQGLPIGQLVKTSVCWFLCSGTIGRDRLSQETYRAFLTSGLLMAQVAQQLLDVVRPDLLFILNGLFFAERILWEVAKRKGIPVITYERGFLPDTLVFAHDKAACYYDIDKLWDECAHVPLTAQENAKLDTYLQARATGQTDTGLYYPSIKEDEGFVRQKLGLDPQRKTVTMFTNILWDSAILNRDVGFAGMMEWVAETVRYFTARSDAQLIIRVHPAEVRLAMQESRERVADRILESYHDLPAHIKIVPPASNLSSYTLMRLSDLVLVYTSTTGLESALQGVPVIVAGQTHYRGKGFTYDINSPQEYFQLLDRLSAFTRLSDKAIERARRYAYLLFFRYMIPFPLVTVLERGRVHLNFDTLAHLLPGRDPYLDLICDAILNGKDFVIPSAKGC